MSLSNGKQIQPARSCFAPAGDERELIRRLAAGDAAALEGLIRQHRPAVISYAARMLEGSDLAEDIAQETFVRLWERRGSWASADSLRPLLYRIARNLALNEKRRVRVRVHSTEKASRASVCRGPTPMEVVEEGELRTCVEAAINGLPVRRREVFVLARFHDLTFREIAEVMGISPQTVANQMSSALRDLQTALRPFLADRAGTFPAPSRQLDRKRE